jgi:hypothetical protein
MAQRMTRRKIRDQADKMRYNLRRVMENLQYMDDLAGGQSEYLNHMIPKLVLMLEGIDAIFKEFKLKL